MLSSAFPNGLHSLLQNKRSVSGAEAWVETTLQGVQLKSRGLKFGKDDLKKLEDIREEGYTQVTRSGFLGIGVMYPNWKAAGIWPMAAIALKRSAVKWCARGLE